MKFRHEEVFFFFPKTCSLALGPTQPPTQLVPGVLSTGVKRPRRETEHSPLSCGKRMSGTIPPFPLHDFTAWTEESVPFFTFSQPGQKENAVVWLERSVLDSFRIPSIGVVRSSAKKDYEEPPRTSEQSVMRPRFEPGTSEHRQKPTVSKKNVTHQ